MNRKNEPIIIVICPGSYVTGGPEALHQLVDMANHVQADCAAICYFPFDIQFEKNEAYKLYDTPIIEYSQIPSGAVVIIPEVFPNLVLEFEQRCVLWWLSIDNFQVENQYLLELFDLHVSQSTYAMQELTARYQLNSFILSDYVNTDFQAVKEQNKQRLIAVNPSKGAGLIQKFRDLNPQIPVVALENLTRNEVREVLASAMAYIDFGHHPGKDRLPREAALLNTVVYARRAGAARIFADVPIHDEYLFDELPELSLKLQDFFDQYPVHIENQLSFHDQVRGQRQIFNDEVIHFIAACKTLDSQVSRVAQRREVLRLVDQKLNNAFYCPLCGEITQKRPVHREDSACQCGASWRAQACMLSILEGLRISPSLKPVEIKSDLSTLGVGISDDFLLSKRLSNLFFYTNSFYHCFPILDVVNPPESTINYFDFISCSDVLDQTIPPSSISLTGIYQMLKPGGFVIISVPCSLNEETVEYYPDLESFSINDGALHWTSASGVKHIDEHPKFHEGSGQTLTFRLWSFDDLTRQCESVGFSEVFPPTNLPPMAGGIESGRLGGLIIARKPHE